jgi:hypothetical protein
MFVKLAKQYGRMGVALKPEVSVIHLYGERFWGEIESDATVQTATEKVSYFTFSVRSSSIVRFEIIRQLAPYIGFQIKTQQFLKADDKIDHEIGYGFFGGIDYRYRFVAVSPFVAVPLGSTVNRYKSPVNAGVQVSLIIDPADDE